MKRTDNISDFLMPFYFRGPNLKIMVKLWLKSMQFGKHLIIASSLILIFGVSRGQDAQLIIQADSMAHSISPTLYGAFFEEISHGGDGGLYAELIRNRGFEDSQIPAGCQYVDGFLVPNRSPHFGRLDNKASDWKLPYHLKGDFPGWRVQPSTSGRIQVKLTERHPLSSGSPQNMEVIIQRSKIDLDNSTANEPAIANSGYHGIGIKAHEAYNLSFNVFTDSNDYYNGNIIAGIYSADSQLIVRKIIKILAGANSWHKYSCSLFADKSVSNGYLTLSFDQPGRLLLDFVSLFPTETYKTVPGGLRKDLAQKIADLHPAFLRWPGGCYVEGMNIESAFNWKNTIGPIIDRPQTFSPWGYWSTNGFGYDEYLKFCEQIGAKGLFVANVGVSCEMRSGTFIPDDSLQPYIQEALDAIEYAIGPVSSTWGALRAKNGHPEPYPLKYIELGNEQAGPRYAARYNRFYRAIHESYPQIEIIASMGLGDLNRYTTDGMQHLDIADEHAYKPLFWSMINYDHFDHYPRKNYKIYVGEYATNTGVSSGNMGAALSDAVYMMGMEKNADIVSMSSYAPLLADVRDQNWNVNLINFNNTQSFGRISYYMIRLFEKNLPDVNIKSTLSINKSSAAKAPLFSGTIGLATWDTQTEYKALKITQKGKIVYQSDFKNRLKEWQNIRGTWAISDSSIAQTAEGPQTLSYLKDHSFDTYTLNLKARKLGGTNAFIIPFGLTDSNTFYRIHIGSWVNSHATIEKVTDGYEVADLITQLPLAESIKTGQWYDIRIKVMEDSVACFLDGKLIMTYKAPKKLFALAGKDLKTGDIIIKMVNAYPAAKDLEVNFNNNKGGFFENASWDVLSAPGIESENSLEHPYEFIPKHLTLKISGKKFPVQLPPFSISVLRLKKQLAILNK